MGVHCPGQAVPLNHTCSVGIGRGKCPKDVGITRREKITQGCVQATSKDPDAKDNRSKEEGVPRWAIIGGSVVGLLLIFLISICVIKTSRSRRPRTIEKTGTDLNPVYGDYSDVYISTEVTDRNTSNYSSQDNEGATQIMDLNSQYGQ